MCWCVTDTEGGLHICVALKRAGLLASKKLEDCNDGMPVGELGRGCTGFCQTTPVPGHMGRVGNMLVYVTYRTYLRYLET